MNLSGAQYTINFITVLQTNVSIFKHITKMKEIYLLCCRRDTNHIY